MAFINIEIKARTNKADGIRQYLLNHQAELHGTDEQTDTYFNVAEGRLKLRQGNIENNLIYYTRVETSGPKQSDVELVKTEDGTTLKSMLSKALGVKIVVKKKREIYYINNVKFHLDTLEGLGSFVEIEASNRFEDIDAGKLRQQCEAYMKEFDVKEKDLIKCSYSDLVEGMTNNIRNIYNDLVEVADVEIQKEYWMGKKPHHESSYVELMCRLFDDNNFDLFVHKTAVEINLPAEVIFELRTLREMLNNYREKNTHLEILEDPAWHAVVAQAKIVKEKWFIT